MSRLEAREVRVVRRAVGGEREPDDLLNGTPSSVLDALPTDAAPVRHLAHRMLEALS